MVHSRGAGEPEAVVSDVVGGWCVRAAVEVGVVAGCFWAVGLRSLAFWRRCEGDVAMSSYGLARGVHGVV